MPKFALFYEPTFPDQPDVILERDAYSSNGTVSLHAAVSITSNYLSIRDLLDSYIKMTQRPFAVLAFHDNVPDNVVRAVACNSTGLPIIFTAHAAHQQHDDKGSPIWGRAVAKATLGTPQFVAKFTDIILDGTRQHNLNRTADHPVDSDRPISGYYKRFIKNAGPQIQGKPYQQRKIESWKTALLTMEVINKFFADRQKPWEEERPKLVVVKTATRPRQRKSQPAEQAALPFNSAQPS